MTAVSWTSFDASNPESGTTLIADLAVDVNDKVITYVIGSKAVVMKIGV